MISITIMSNEDELQIVPADRALMIVNDFTIHGSTRLQKYGFLLSKQYADELSSISHKEPKLQFYDDWKPLWYGPFSKNLEDDINECVESRLVYKEPIDLRLNSYRYSFTLRGRIRWRKMHTNFQNEMNSIYEKIANLQKIQLERLLERIYAAYPEYIRRSTITDRFS